MLRTSSYTIYVDLPDRRDELLLVHGYTGAYDRVSRRVGHYLRSREIGRPPKPLYGEWSDEPSTPEDIESPGDDVIELLRSRGYLTELDRGQEETFFARLAETLHARAKQRTPSYVFLPTYDCNLRCPYCFQDAMRTDESFAHLLRTMRPSMIDRIFRALPAIEAHHGLEPSSSRRRDIGFFGGEPLLARNRPVVERIVERAREMGPCGFWAVTNATELDAYADLLGSGGLERLQITIDGPPEEHDRRRVDAAGGGTWSRIAPNIDLALDAGARVQVRLNIDRRNLHELPAVADELVARGWVERPGFGAYAAPIHASNAQTERATTLDSWELDQALCGLREEHETMRHIARPDEAIRRRARSIFEDGEHVLPELTPSFCGAHDRMYLFDPFGDVYACWERTGDPRIRIARVNEEAGIDFEHETHHEWRSRSVASNPACRRCRYALHCGGGCAILALGRRGKLHANYCDGFASRFRASIADAYGSHERGEALGNAPESLCDL